MCNVSIINRITHFLSYHKEHASDQFADILCDSYTQLILEKIWHGCANNKVVCYAIYAFVARKLIVKNVVLI